MLLNEMFTTISDYKQTNRQIPQSMAVHYSKGDFFMKKKKNKKKFLTKMMSLTKEMHFFSDCIVVRHKIVEHHGFQKKNKD